MKDIKPILSHDDVMSCGETLCPHFDKVAFNCYCKIPGGHEMRKADRGCVCRPYYARQAKLARRGWTEDDWQTIPIGVVIGDKKSSEAYVPVMIVPDDERDQ